jgi:hypothetical protein
MTGLVPVIIGLFCACQGTAKQVDMETDLKAMYADLPLEYRFIAANNFKKRKRFGVISGEVLKEYNFIPCDDIHKYCDLLQADNVDVLSDIKNKKEMLENAFNGLVPMQIGTSYYDVTLEKSKVKEL